MSNIIMYLSTGRTLETNYEVIEHHGILGQKWGIRRYQNSDGSLTRAGKNHIGQNGQKGPNGSSNRVGQLDPDVANALYEVGGTAAAALAYVAYLVTAIKTKEKKETKAYNEELDYMYKKRDIKTLKEAPKLKEPMAASESMKIVNPGFPKDGRTENCTLCTTAMVMREKGYDVKANTIDHGLYNKNIEHLYGDSAQHNKIKAKKTVDIVNKLNTEGDGAYGELTIRWNLGGGHSVFWKNEDGKTHIYDGQSGEEYYLEYNLDNPKYSNFLKKITNKGATYTRLDNVEPNELVLSAVTK